MSWDPYKASVRIGSTCVGARQGGDFAFWLTEAVLESISRHIGASSTHSMDADDLWRFRTVASHYNVASWEMHGDLHMAVSS